MFFFGNQDKQTKQKKIKTKMADEKKKILSISKMADEKKNLITTKTGHRIN